MDKERIGELGVDYRSALSRLSEALADDLSKGSIVVDGTIQRFEFTFELAWKLQRAILFLKGIQANTPRDAIKESFRIDLIQDGDGWIAMLEDRNITSHVYDEATALRIYGVIKNKYHKLLLDFAAKAQELLL